jgi:hypothetical protein
LLGADHGEAVALVVRGLLIPNARYAHDPGAHGGGPDHTGAQPRHAHHAVAHVRLERHRVAHLQWHGQRGPQRISAERQDRGRLRELGPRAVERLATALDQRLHRRERQLDHGAVRFAQRTDARFAAGTDYERHEPHTVGLSAK